jgi:hypothetical protein
MYDKVSHCCCQQVLMVMVQHTQLLRCRAVIVTRRAHVLRSTAVPTQPLAWTNPRCTSANLTYHCAYVHALPTPGCSAASKTHHKAAIAVASGAPLHLVHAVMVKAQLQRQLPAQLLPRCCILLHLLR